MTNNFLGLNIVITGATGVIGSTFAKGLVQKGANVGMLGRSQNKIKELQLELDSDGNQTIILEGDVLDKKTLKKAKELFNSKFGKIDVLLNVAGGNNPQATTEDEFYNSQSSKTFFDLDSKSVEQVFNLNYLGSFLPSQVFGEDIVNSNTGTIINISSMNAFTPLTKIPAYSGAKSSINNFTQWLATYFASNIRVNAIAPGFFETNQNRELLRNEDGSYSNRAKKILSQTPMNRFGKPEELLGTLYWLIDSQQSGFVTGVVIPVDGGFSSYSGV